MQWYATFRFKNNSAQPHIQVFFILQWRILLPEKFSFSGRVEGEKEPFSPRNEGRTFPRKTKGKKHFAQPEDPSQHLDQENELLRHGDASEKSTGSRNVGCGNKYQQVHQAVITTGIHGARVQINMVIFLVLPNLTLGNFGCGPIIIRQTHILVLKRNFR